MYRGVISKNEGNLTKWIRIFITNVETTWRLFIKILKIPIFIKRESKRK